jgi:nucleoid DNA-binding protein
VADGERVTFHGFGSFEARWRGENPEVKVPAFRGAVFKAVVVVDGEPSMKAR